MCRLDLYPRQCHLYRASESIVVPGLRNYVLHFIKTTEVEAFLTFEILFPHVRPMASPPKESHHTLNVSGNSLCIHGTETAQYTWS